MYLHHEGFAEDESHEIIFQRHSDQDDIEYIDPEEVIDAHKPHFSSLVMKKSYAIKYLDCVIKYSNVTANPSAIQILSNQS